MSLTFTCMDAPTTKGPCPYCMEGRQGGWLREDENCDPWCTGIQESSTSPDVNLSNSNAKAILGLLQFPYADDDPYGQCDGGTLKQRILLARNSDRHCALRDPQHIHGGHAGVSLTTEGNVVHMQRMGAEFFDFGTTDERTLDRLEALWTLATFAQAHGFNISWG